MQPSRDVVYPIVSRLLQKDERRAIEWLDAHRDDSDYASGLEALAQYWQIRKPEDAAKIIARMPPGKRTQVAGYLVSLWSRLDPKAAQDFLERTFPQGSQEREKVDEQIKSLEKYAWDKWKRK